MKPRILPAVTICSLVVFAPAVALPLEGRLVGLVTESYGLEAEIVLRPVLLTLGARTVSLDGRAPGGQFVYVRITGGYPSATPAFGVSGSPGAVVVPTSARSCMSASRPVFRLVTGKNVLALQSRAATTSGTGATTQRDSNPKTSR